MIDQQIPITLCGTKLYLIFECIGINDDSILKFEFNKAFLRLDDADKYLNLINAYTCDEFYGLHKIIEHTMYPNPNTNSTFLHWNPELMKWTDDDIKFSVSIKEICNSLGLYI